MVDEAQVLRITYAGATSRPSELEVVLSPGDQWTFGRSSRCDLQLNDADFGVSRGQGKIHFDGQWMLTTTSTKRACYVERSGRARQAVPPGESIMLAGTVAVIVMGDVFTYRIGVSVGEVAEREAVREPESETSTFVPSLSESEKWAIAAMAWGYLQDGARHDPNPLTYAEAASLLDLSGKTVRNRVEHFRGRLDAVGIPGVTAPDARRAVVEFCLTHKLIEPEIIDEVRAKRR